MNGTYLFPLVLLWSITPIHEFLREFQKIELTDGASYPLQSNDNGITFDFSIEARSTVNCYLEINERLHTLLENKRGPRGPWSITLKSKTVADIFPGVGNGSASFILSERHDLTNRLFPARLSLDYIVEAPYGTTLQILPRPPTYRPTNLRRKETNSNAVLGLIVGAGLILGGLDSDEIGSGDKDNPAVTIGLVIAIYSLTKISRYVPDIVTNNTNIRANNSLKSNYDNVCRNIERHNNSVTSTYYVLLKKREF